MLPALTARALVLLAIAVSAVGIGGWKCEVCQDVVMTFRRQWPTLGARSLVAPITEGGADPETVVAPASPGCNAFAMGSPLRAKCVAGRQDLGLDPRLSYHVWASLKNAVSSGEICGQLGKCGKLPALDATGVRKGSTPEQEAAIKCERASRTARCQLDPNCPAYQKFGCSDECVACLWLVRSWPQFNSICAPKAPSGGAAAPPAATGSSATAKPLPGKASRFAQRRRRRRLEAEADEAADELAEEGAQEDVDGADGVDAAADSRLQREDAADAELHERDAGGGEDGEAEDGPLPPSPYDAPALALLETRGGGGAAGDAQAGAAAQSSGGAVAMASRAPTSTKGGPAAASPGPSAGDDSALTTSAWRGAATPALIPKGLGSPPLSQASGTIPTPEAVALQAECLTQYHTLSAVPEAWAAITATGNDGRLSGVTWDPLTSCRCLSRCPYNSIDALAVEDACGGLFDDRVPYVAGKRLLAGLSRMQAEQFPEVAAARAGERGGARDRNYAASMS